MIGKTSKETISNIDSLEYKERIEFIRENKDLIFDQKKSEFKQADVVCYSLPKSSTLNTIKMSSEELRNKNSLDVTAIGNLSMYFDSHRDVQGDKCWNQSLKNIGLVFHAKDHNYSTDGIIGEMKSIYMQSVRTDKLGITSDIKSAQALVFESEVFSELDKKIHFQYGKGLIKQHSVGMYYDKLKFAVNDKEDEDGFKIYNKYIDKIINKEEVDKFGYFFYVEESRLIEISAVTRGSNPITYTLDVKQSDDTSQPKEHGKTEQSDDTQKEQERQNYYKTLLN